MLMLPDPVAEGEEAEGGRLWREGVAEEHVVSQGLPHALLEAEHPHARFFRSCRRTVSEPVKKCIVRP